MNNYIVTIGGSDIDYFYEVESFLKAGDACICKPLESRVGGCVYNAAGVMSSLGNDTKVLDYLKKDDEGTNLLINALKQEGIDVSNIHYGENVVNGNCLIMQCGKEKCIYVIDPSHPCYPDSTQIADLLNNASYIYSLMRIIMLSFGNFDAIKKARSHGAKIIIDGGCQYTDEYQWKMLFEIADGIFLNTTAYDRLKQMAGEDVIDKLIESGTEFICVTDGEKGADCYYKGGHCHSEALSVDVIDSTGAGDSFAGCFVSCLNKGYSFSKALKMACANGGYACCGIGGNYGAISEQQLVEFARKNNYEID